MVHHKGEMSTVHILMESKKTKYQGKGFLFNLSIVLLTWGSVRDVYATSCSHPSGITCEITAPKPYLDVSSVSFKGKEGS